MNAAFALVDCSRPVSFIFLVHLSNTYFNLQLELYILLCKTLSQSRSRTYSNDELDFERIKRNVVIGTLYSVSVVDFQQDFIQILERCGEISLNCH